jgi:hypothetical protein
MSDHKLRVDFLVLTPYRKTLFLRWALDGFKRPQTPSRVAFAKWSEKAA